MDTVTAPARPTRRRRWLKRGLLVVLILVILGSGGWFAISWLSGRDLKNIIAELDRTDPGWRLEDIEAKRKVLPPEENSALQVMAALSLMGGKNVGITRAFDLVFDNLTPQCQLNLQQIEYLERDLRPVEKAIESARKLKDMPEGRFPIAYAPDFFSTLLPNQQNARTIMNLLQWDAVWRAHNNDIDGALESCHALLNCSRSLGEDPLMICQLVRYAGTAIFVECLERALGQGAACEKSLSALQAILKREMLEPTFLTSVRGERGGIHMFMLACEAGKANLAGLGVRQPESQLLFFLPGYTRRQHAKILEHMTELFEAAKLPLHEQDAAISQLEANLAKDKSGLAAQLVPAVAKCSVAFLRTQVFLRVALVAVAAERYRLANKAWPKTLDDLIAAKLLDAIPDDPFARGPIRLKHDPNALVIYSVGRDRIDDGGNFDRREPMRPGTDIGIRMWNVDARRQPPQPTVTVTAEDLKN